MDIRLATIKDLNDILEVYSIARQFMIKTGNPRQWAEKNWPPKSLIEQDIQNKKCYVCQSDGQIVAVFYYDFGFKVEKCYNQIDGEWIGDQTYGVVHRIASNGVKKGAGRFCLEWAINLSNHLRIDTHSDNTVMQNLLEKLGFTKCGIIHIKEDSYPRIAYEKVKVH